MKWISVEDELPPAEIRILFVIKEDTTIYYGLREDLGDYSFYYACDFEFPYGLEGLSDDKTVTHWMPLPALPNDEEETDIEKVQREIREFQTQQTKIAAAEIKKDMSSIMKRYEKKVSEMSNRIAVLLISLQKNGIESIGIHNKVKTELEKQMNAFTSIEETFFILYHNIKKNQFLYANDEEAWWKDYTDLKKHYKKQKEN